MKKEQILGLIRNILIVLGGYFASEGYIDTNVLESTIGSLMVLIPLVWSVIDKTNRDLNVWKSIIRSAISTFGGVFISLNIIDEKVWNDIAGLIISVSSLFLSFKENKK